MEQQIIKLKSSSFAAVKENLQSLDNRINELAQYNPSASDLEVITFPST